MTGKNVKGERPAAPASKAFSMAAHLHTNDDIAAYLEAALEEGDSRVLTVALRDAAQAIGGMTELARRAGLSRETLYRTLSPHGNPRLDTLTALLHAFGLRLSVQPKAA